MLNLCFEYQINHFPQSLHLSFIQDITLNNCCCYVEEHSLRGMGPSVYLFLSQAAILPRSDVGSNGVRPHASCDDQCMGYTVSIWFAACSVVSHLQFDKGVRLHLCMGK